MNKIYKFHRIDKANDVDLWEDVDIDDYLWQWEAKYKDGTILRQFDTDNPLTKEFGNNVFSYHQVKEIDVPNLMNLHMVSPRLNKKYSIIWNSHWTPVIIYIRANLVIKVWHDKKQFADTGEKVPKQVERRVFTAAAYGYTNKVGGVVTKHFNVIMPRGEIITTDDLNNIKLDAKPIEEWM